MTFKRQSLLKTIWLVLLLTLLSAAYWNSRVFIDRSLKSANPIPLQEAEPPLSASLKARIENFIENEAAGTDSLVILKNGRILLSYGPTDAPSNLHSGTLLSS